MRSGARRIGEAFRESVLPDFARHLALARNVRRAALRFAWMLACILAFLLIGETAQAEMRVALVIGEGQYQSVPALPNPPNDASDVAEALRALGFATTLKVDLGLDEMKQVVADFSAASAKADVSLFYYGGHGMQVSGHNYLIPVDAKLHSVEDIHKATYSFDDLLGALSKGPGQHLIFLDACRNDPVKDGGGAALVKGLAQAGKREGFLMVYATQPDNVARDGAGRNSPFAQALLAHVAEPGADVSSMIIEVRRDVIGATGGEQVPWENSSLTKQFYFAGEAQAGASPETLMWRLAASQRDPNLLQIYLAKYPTGAHAGDARSLLADAGAAAMPVKTSSSVEEDLWSLALAARSRELAELYGARYPAGAHVAQAKSLLASLKASEAASNDPTIQCARLATDPERRQRPHAGRRDRRTCRARRRRHRRLPGFDGRASGRCALRGAARARAMGGEPFRRIFGDVPQGRRPWRRPRDVLARLPPRPRAARHERPASGGRAVSTRRRSGPGRRRGQPRRRHL